MSKLFYVILALCQTEEVGIKIYVGKAIKRPPPDRAIGPCLTELDKWQHLAPQNEQSRYEKKMILANTNNWNHMIMGRYKKKTTKIIVLQPNLVVEKEKFFSLVSFE